MGWLKSIYVSAYMTGAMVTLALAIAHVAGGGRDLTWIGAGAATAPFLALLGWLMLFRPTARTSNRLPLITLLTVAGGTIAIYGYAAEGGSAAGLAAALGSVAGYVVYGYWYTALDRPPAPRIAVGQPLPELVLESAQGAEISSASFRGAPSLWMFYRGNWCPLCMAQVKEIAAQYRELADRGVRVALVSPQSHRNTEKLAARFDVPFEFLVDVDNRAARALGIEAKGGLPAGIQVLGYDSDTVLPTVIITDAAGTIIFSDQTDNYRVRPEPATFLGALDQHT